MGEAQMTAPDKMKIVREAGEAIRMDLTKVLEHRFEKQIDDAGLAEIKLLVEKLASSYLQQIVPSVEVKVLHQTIDGGLKLSMVLTGILTITVAPDPDATDTETTA